MREVKNTSASVMSVLEVLGEEVLPEEKNLQVIFEDRMCTNEEPEMRTA